MKVKSRGSSYGRRGADLSLAVLKNKINRGLVVFGVNSVAELVSRYPENFECVVFREKSQSSKISRIKSLVGAAGICSLENNDLFHDVEKMGYGDVRVIGVLASRIESFVCLSEVLDQADRNGICTVVAFYGVDYEQNLGAMIRTCAGMGVDFIIVPNGQQNVFSPVVTRVSMGYNYTLPLVRENFFLAVDNLKEHGFLVVGLDAEGSDIRGMEYTPKVCLIVGNEGRGLGSSVLGKCDVIASIPMRRDVESLNVSVSLGIALYDRLSKSK